MKRLEGRVALITGAGSGIGRATAELFAKEGASVALFGRRRHVLEETAALVRAQGVRCSVSVGSVAEEKDVRAAVAAAVSELGGLHVLINNAGVGGFGPPLHETTDEDFRRVMSVNLEGAWRVMRASIPEMLKAGWGAIVNISSTHGQVGLPGSAIYCASKGGLINLTRAVALEYAKHGIRCNCVCPAAVETDMLAPALSDPATKAWIVGSHPIGRIGTPGDIAKSILHLACDEASWVTGSVFTIDGGLTAQ